MSPFRCSCAVVTVLLGAAVIVSASDPTRPPKEDQPAALARRAWAAADLVLEKHVEPPARPRMLLAGIQGLLESAKKPAPADLERRVSALAGAEPLAGLIRELGLPPAPARQLEVALLSAMMKEVPGPAQLVPADVYRAIEQASHNRYVGTGIQIRYNQQEKRTQLVTPFRDGPAHKAGARPGDLIVEIAGKDTKGMPLGEVVERLRGEEGTPVRVVVRQPGSDERRTLKMIRSVAFIDSVQGCRRDGDSGWTFRARPGEPIGYLCVKSLTTSTLHELRQAERRLRDEGLRALVLDLRGAGGEHVQQAALVADGLLDGGLLWKVREAGGRVKEYRADRDCLFRDLPLAVLVDENSFGAGPELLAAALQDNGRAVLVGETMPWDGYVQSYVALPDGGALVLRTGVVERPAARDGKPSSKGVQPDHRVKMSAEQKEAVDRWLQLKNFTELPAGARDEPPDDPQLAKAVEVLRGALKPLPK